MSYENSVDEVTPFMKELIGTGEFTLIDLPQDPNINAAYGTKGLEYNGVTLIFAEGEAGGVTGVTKRKDLQLPAMQKFHELGIPFVNVVRYRGAAGIGEGTSMHDLGQMLTLPVTTLADVGPSLDAIGRILKMVARVPQWKLLKFDPEKDSNDPKTGFTSMLRHALEQYKKEA